MDDVEIVARQLCKEWGGDPDGLTRTLQWGDDEDVVVECKGWEPYVGQAERILEAIRDRIKEPG